MCRQLHTADKSAVWFPLLRSIVYRLSLLLCLVGVGMTVVQAQDVTTPQALLTPAIKVGKVENATLLAVTRAGDRLVAAGEHGIIVTSDDDGASWHQSEVPVSVNLTALRFIDERQGWAVGHMGVVLHTNDGGQTWSKQLDGIQAAQIAVTAVRDSDNERAIKRAKYLLSDGPDKPFFDIWMDANGKGFVVGAFNLILQTDDAGQHWHYWSTHVHNRFGLHLYGITRHGNHFIIVGEQGLLLRSDDGGDSFNALESPYEGSLFGVLSTHNNQLLAYGLRGNAFVSNDGADHWQACNTQTRVSISAAGETRDGAILLANQAGQIFVSHDQGLSFKPSGGLPGNPFAALTVSKAGNLILAGLRGLNRLDSSFVAKSDK